MQECLDLEWAKDFTPETLAYLAIVGSPGARYITLGQSPGVKERTIWRQGRGIGISAIFNIVADYSLTLL
ncbi:MAG: hypothetical protein ACE5HC_02230 [Candidatus Binatia bacterium]